MFNHISIGVRDIKRSGAFYDAALAPLGVRRLSDGENSLGYGKEAAVFWLYATGSPVPPDPKSGLHFCFDAPSRKAVAAFHAAAIEAGGRDNGAPGVRTDYSPDYYAAFVVDPDGYRLEALRLGA
jgi:catechol 2,3-dioxygenase-like lactoylglutathione lyase family enzyme